MCQGRAAPWLKIGIMSVLRLGVKLVAWGQVGASGGKKGPCVQASSLRILHVNCGAKSSEKLKISAQ